MIIRDLPHCPAGNHRKHWSLLALIGCCAGLGCNTSTSNPGASLRTVTFPSASSQQWVKQSSIGSTSTFGTDLNNFTTNIALSPNGSVTALGRISRGFSTTENVQEQEFLATYDGNGNPVASVPLAQDTFANISTIATGTPDGNYVAASTPATVESSPTLLPLNVEKFTAAGSPMWTAVLPTTNLITSFQPRSVTADASGNILVAGQIGGPNLSGVFFAKFDGSTGNIMWQNEYPSVGLSGVQNTAVGPDGSLYAAVEGNSSLTATLTSTSIPSCFLTKLDSGTGKIVWTTTAPAGVCYRGVAVNSAGNGYIIGGFGKDRSVGYLAGFSAQSGTLTWQKQFGDGALLPTNITVDFAGDAVFVGDVEGADFTSPITQKDLFVAKIAPTGTPVWLQKFGSGYDFRSVDGEVSAPPYVVTDEQNNVYVSGSVNGAFPGFQNPSGQAQVFIAKFAYR